MVTDTPAWRRERERCTLSSDSGPGVAQPSLLRPGSVLKTFGIPDRDSLLADVQFHLAFALNRNPLQHRPANPGHSTLDPQMVDLGLVVAEPKHGPQARLPAPRAAALSVILLRCDPPLRAAQ